MKIANDDTMVDETPTFFCFVDTQHPPYVLDVKGHIIAIYQEPAQLTGMLALIYCFLQHFCVA